MRLDYILNKMIEKIEWAKLDTKDFEKEKIVSHEDIDES